MTPRRLLLFGASGAIGGTVAARSAARGWSVTRVARREPDNAGGSEPGQIVWDPLAEDRPAALSDAKPFDAVCWAQGANMSDSLSTFDAEAHMALYAANVLLVMKSAAVLLKGGMFREGGARLVIVSSIWQERARGNKLSYTVSKAAVGGLVRSISVDLGAQGHLVNGVLPGVLETPMTRANMTSEQMAAVMGRSSLGRLPDLGTVADTILFLLSAENNAITGQSITVDLGMSNACLL